ncbi:hypothetical protein M878_40905 [Streptomyces roseochromogenus subsp. oscitans DS 12.976]|uniref:Uncharacterized protein n=1 Tax=Streptomyces roseochromogenus subsp. oscitans DS 12.976 TaxID=1352936 RepID=V6JSR9_STRRC|nr:hypothetical protein M878_40905 [Streptomyces roseochromogenus subsp. oscitans DS 12.976]
MVYAGGFLEGAGSHVLDLVRGGLHAYAAFGPVPLQVFFVALVVLDPLVAVLTLWMRPSGVRAAGVLMTLDVLANWYVNRSWVQEDPAALLRPVGLLPITVFGAFVLATLRPLLHALNGRDPRCATADLPVARPPLIRKDAGRQSGPHGNGAHR